MECELFLPQKLRGTNRLVFFRRPLPFLTSIIMAALSTSQLKYPKTPHLPFSPGVSADDIVLSSARDANIPLLSQETILTEKLDGGNCSIYHGKVCLSYCTNISLVLAIE